ncbi:MAG: hypothetical protein R3F43_02200 [bacterium]
MLVLFGGVAHAAEDADPHRPDPHPPGLVRRPLGGARGLSFRAPTAAIDTRLDAVPALALGVDYWPDPALGLHLALHAGLGAEVGVP